MADRRMLLAFSILVLGGEISPIHSILMPHTWPQPSMMGSVHVE